MDEKTFSVLEFPKVLQRLEKYADFSASATLARAIRPTNDLELAQERLARTTEARRLLSEQAQISIGGAHDIRPQILLAERSGVLAPEELMDIKSTLVAARGLARSMEKYVELLPHLSSIAASLPPPPGLIEAISNVLGEQGQVLDNASEKLANLRRELKAANERLMGKLQRMVNDPKTTQLLQEPIITSRNGRYVVPVRAENKGKLKGLIQDQSSSGATIFVEPLAVVELNNHFIEVQFAEQEEIRRILAQLSALVGASTAQLQGVVRGLAAFDLALMCAKYAEELRAVEPLLKPFPDGKQPQTILRLMQARHPLLDQKTVVPIDVALENGTHGLVITGPNTGGKTVTLKTVGLLTLMAQAGLHIPAQSGSELCLVKDVFADIGDEQSIEQSLSTFSSHITNIVRILKRVNNTTLVLLDELGAGTDPQEGSALARAILGYLVVHRVPCLIATHYPELKAYAHSTAGVINASMEFDLKSLKPTYHLIMGLPGRSNALAIAQRLGLSAEIIQESREMINPADLRAEDLLEDIHRQRDAARQDRVAAGEARGEADELRHELEERLEKIEQERQLILEKANREAQQELDNLQQELAIIRKELRGMQKPNVEIKPVQERIKKLEEKVSRPVEYVQPVVRELRPLKVGDRVHLRSLDVEGVVTELLQNDVEVQVGKMRLKVPTHDLRRSEKQSLVTSDELEPAGSIRIEDHMMFASPGAELHLRGMRVEDAVVKLEQYLDSAFAAGLPYVRIVHGKGTGTLRQVVRKILSESTLVKSWEEAMHNEGGEGVTVAHLKTD